MRFALLLACLLAYLPSAHAQTLPAALMLRPSALTPVGPELRLQPLDRELVAAQRSRLLLASGIGALSAATVHAAVFGTFGGCGHSTAVSPRQFVSAAIVGAVGAAFTIGGGLRLGRVPQESWRRASPGQKAAAFFTSFAVASVTEAALLAFWVASPTCS